MFGLLAGLAAPAGVGAAASGTVVATGSLTSFGPFGGTVAGFAVYVLEHPELSTVTDADGRWRIDAIPVGSDVTFAMDGDEVRYPMHTATFAAVDHDLEGVTFQSPARSLIDAFGTLLGTATDAHLCHIAATVTRAGYSLDHGAPDGTHGEPGATVSISPKPTRGATPIYFNGSRFDVIWPDANLEETTADGGLTFVNVTPGTYTLTAHKQGATIRSVTVRCIAGRLANASPPWGLQVTAGGLGPDDTVPFPSPTTTSTAAPSTTTAAPQSSTTSAAPAAPPARPATAIAGDSRFTG